MTNLNMFKKPKMSLSIDSYKSFLVCILLFMTCSYVYGQNTFHLAYGGAALDKCNAMYYDGGNEILIAGETASFDTKEKSILLIKDI